MCFLNKKLTNSLYKKLKYLEGKVNEIKFSPYAKLLKNNEHPISAKIKKIVYTKEQKEFQISACGIVYDANEDIIGVWDEEKQQLKLEIYTTDRGIKVKKIMILNKQYFMSSIGVIYYNDATVMGRFDKKNKQIIFEVESDDEDEDEDENEDEEEIKHENPIPNANVENIIWVQSNTDNTCEINENTNNAHETRVNTELRKKITKSLKKDEGWVRPRNYAQLYLPPHTLLTKTYKGRRFLVEWTGTHFKSYRQRKEITYKSLSNAYKEFLKTQGVKTRYNVWITFKTLAGQSVDRLDLYPIS